MRLAARIALAQLKTAAWNRNWRCRYPGRGGVMGSYKLWFIVDSRRLAAAPGPFFFVQWPLAPGTCTWP